MKAIRVLFVLVVATSIFVLAACGGATAVPSATPMSTNTLVPLVTAVPTATQKPIGSVEIVGSVEGYNGAYFSALKLTALDENNFMSYEVGVDCRTVNKPVGVYLNDNEVQKGTFLREENLALHIYSKSVPGSYSCVIDVTLSDDTGNKKTFVRDVAVKVLELPNFSGDSNVRNTVLTTGLPPEYETISATYPVNDEWTAKLENGMLSVSFDGEHFSHTYTMVCRDDEDGLSTCVTNAWGMPKFSAQRSVIVNVEMGDGNTFYVVYTGQGNYNVSVLPK